MSDQYPPGPQQPGYQPGQPGYQPQQGDPTASTPYGNAQPYGQPTPPPASQQPGQPYGQPAPGYGQNPYMYNNQQQGVRPGAATGASVVGIIDGSLGILAGIIGFAGVSALQSLGETLRVGNSIGLAITLGYIQAAGTLITAVALLIGGITFLRGNRYNVLLYAAFAQVALVLLNMVYSLMASSASTSYNGSWIIGVAIGLGLAGRIIYVLSLPVSTRGRMSKDQHLYLLESLAVR